MIDYDELTKTEQRAISSLKKLAKKWPSSLSLFSNNGTLEVHRNGEGEPFTEESYVEDIYGIFNDGGDRD